MRIRGLAVAAAAAAALAVSGCGGEGDVGGSFDSAYCVNGAGMVVDDWHCGGSDPAFWYLMGAWSHPWHSGQVVNVTHVHVTRIQSTNIDARRQWGMPPSGPVRAGSRFTPPPSGPVQARSNATGGARPSSGPVRQTAKPPVPPPAPRPAAPKPPAPKPPAPRVATGGKH